jgi:RecB family endonuclease NucS
MPEEIRFWQVEKDNLTEISIAKLNREERIETWILRDISILDSRLLVIGQQVETAYGQFIDLLCVDSVGGLVIVELRRDKTPREVTAQALDYASWTKTLNAEQIEKIADDHLKSVGDTLETAFRKKFNSELPDVLNEHHSMVIVASPTSSTLLHVDMEGRATPLWEQRGAWRTWAVASPNGRELAIMGMTSRSNVWIIENF